MAICSRSSRLASITLLVTLVTLLLMPAQTTRAMPGDVAYYQVDTFSDSIINSGCDDGMADNDCALRGAISLANSLPADSIVHITLPAGTYTLVIAGWGENANANGDLDVIGNEVTLSGAGSGLTVLNAGALDRMLDHHSGILKLNDLQITNGYTQTSSMGGAAVLNRTAAVLYLSNVVLEGNTAAGSNPGINYGGGIANFGWLTISNTLINNNKAYYGAGIASYEDSYLSINQSTLSNNTTNLNGAAGRGGGIYLDHANVEIRDTTLYHNETYYGGGIRSDNQSVLTLERVTLSANEGAISGGGIANYSSLNLSNVTFSGNTTGPTGSGGGLANYGASGFATLNHVTFANNLANTNGHAIYAEVNSTQTIHNSILASNSINQKTCFFGTPSTFNDAGYNLSSDASCKLTAPAHDIFPTTPVENPQLDPLLGSLADNGGPTHTLALLPGSPAIDAGDPGDYLGVDQRGYFRPGTGSLLPDIGAFELNGLILDILFYLPVISPVP